MLQHSVGVILFSADSVFVEVLAHFSSVILHLVVLIDLWRPSDLILLGRERPESLLHFPSFVERHQRTFAQVFDVLLFAFQLFDAVIFSLFFFFQLLMDFLVSVLNIRFLVFEELLY